MPSAYAVIITVFGTLLDSSQVPPRCTSTCVFKRKMKGSKSEISSYSILNSTQSAHVACETNFSGSMWIEDEIQLDVQLPDCRYSTSNLSMKMFCPKQFYQSALAARNGCEQCPSPHSTTLNINQNNITSCVCNIGFYGTFGESCIQCPSHPGFNCSMYASKVPQIKPGYYIEFDKMHLCSPGLRECPAIMKCPFAYA